MYSRVAIVFLRLTINLFLELGLEARGKLAFHNRNKFKRQTPSGYQPKTKKHGVNCTQNDELAPKISFHNLNNLEPLGVEYEGMENVCVCQFFAQM